MNERTDISRPRDSDQDPETTQGKAPEAPKGQADTPGHPLSGDGDPGSTEPSAGTGTAASSTPGPVEAMQDAQVLTARVHESLRGCYDPEIPVNIVELGLIYNVEADDEGKVKVLMTLTAPNCPAAETLPVDVENAARAVPGVQDVKVDLTFDPPWTPARMSEAAKLELNLTHL